MSFPRRLASLARRLGRSIEKPAAVLAGVAIGATIAHRTGLVTADDFGPLAAMSEVAADRIPAAVAPPSELAPFPGVDYAGLRLAVVDARSVPTNRSGVPIVVVDLVVRNDTARQIRLPRSTFRLVRPESEATVVSRFDYGRHDDRMVIDPGDTERALAVFHLPHRAEIDLSLQRLEVGETGRWPVQLPLDGTFPAEVPPLPLEPSPDDGPIVVAGRSFDLTGALVALGHDGYRARVGRHLAVMTFEIERPEPVGWGADRVTGFQAGDRDRWTLEAIAAPGAEPLPTRTLRVVVDEHAPSPVPGPRGTPRWRNPAGSTATVTVVAVYPTEATGLRLVVEADGAANTVGRFDVQPFG